MSDEVFHCLVESGHVEHGHSAPSSRAISRADLEFGSYVAVSATQYQTYLEKIRKGHVLELL